jgi:GNAT superfamily N-acetyltransferase
MEWVRRFLACRPQLLLYFEAAVRALGRGLDNRAVLIGRDARGLALSIDFDSVTVRTTAGDLDPDELREVAGVLRRAELHLEPAHLDEVFRHSRRRVEAVRRLRYYRLDSPAGLRFDPRCRRLGPEDLELVAAFFAAHYPATIFSSWMLDEPFIGLFERGALAACGGTVASEASLAACNLGNFLTHPAHRGRGLARAVAASLITELESRGFLTFTLGTFEENVPACRTYEGIGFRVSELRVQVELSPALEQ